MDFLGFCLEVGGGLITLPHLKLIRIMLETRNLVPFSTEAPLNLLLSKKSVFLAKIVPLLKAISVRAVFEIF